MPAIEWRVLTEILRSGSLAEPLKRGLTAENFKDPEARQIYEFLHSHWFDAQTAFALPSIRYIKRKWPAFQLTGRTEEDSSELPALIKELKTLAFESDARALADYFHEMLTQDNAEEVVRDVKNQMDEMVYQMNSGERLTGSGIAEVAIKGYKNAQSGISMGVPWPWEPMTEDTQGKQPGTFTVFYGRMKSMKTWILLYCATLDYQFNNQRVLIWSREMNKDQIAMRMASIYAGVDYQLFKKGRLPPRLEKKLFEAMEQLTAEDAEVSDPSNQMANIVILAGRGAPKTTAELHGAIMEHQPSVVYLDSFYHFRSPRENAGMQRWARIATIAEETKEMAQGFDIPIIATHQANREGEKASSQGGLSDVADSDAIAREADLIVRILKRKGHALHEDDYESEMERLRVQGSKRFRLKVRPDQLAVPTKALKVEDESRPRVGAEIGMILGGNREGVLEAFTIHAVPGYNFKLISANYSTEEIRQWEKADNVEAEKDKPKRTGSGGPLKPNEKMREAFAKLARQRIVRGAGV